MYGEEERSFVPRTFLVAAHGVIIASVGWFIFSYPAGERVFSLWTAGAPSGRRVAVLAAAVIYFARVCLTALYLLRRRMRWSEAVTIVAWLAFVHGAFSLLIVTGHHRLGAADLAAGLLYTFGSYLNTGAEYGRLRWRQRPEHKGRLYTEGLFRYARHINYFGDTVLFTGYAMLTGRPIALFVPALMVCMFVFVNIPMLERHLRERYGAEFSEYAGRTKSFVPFVY